MNFTYQPTSLPVADSLKELSMLDWSDNTFHAVLQAATGDRGRSSSGKLIHDLLVTSSITNKKKHFVVSTPAGVLEIPKPCEMLFLV